MEALRLDTGAIVDVPSAKDAPNADGRAEVKIKGSKAAVEAAKKVIEERAKVFDDTITKNIEVDRKFHRFIIGTGGKFCIWNLLRNLSLTFDRIQPHFAC
jgi:hypothetical protein